MITRLMSVLALLLSLTLTATAAPPLLIRFAQGIAGPSPENGDAWRFKQRVEKKLAGRVTVEVLADARFDGSQQLLSALNSAEVQMAAPSLSTLSALAPDLQVFDLPFLLNDETAVGRFRNSRIGQRLLRSFEASGIKGLGYWSGGAQVISANRRPLGTSADVQMLVAHIESSHVLFKAQYRQPGVLPIYRLPLEITDILHRTRADPIDGQEERLSHLCLSTQPFDSPQPGVTEVRHRWPGFMILTGKDFWERLPVDIRNDLDMILTEIADETSTKALEPMAEARPTVIHQDRVKISALADQEREVWHEATQPMWSLFASRIDPAVIAAAQRASDPTASEPLTASLDFQMDHHAP